MPTPQPQAARPPSVARAPAGAVAKHGGTKQQRGQPDEPQLAAVGFVEEVPTCRVCYGETEPDNELLAPCTCSGSMRYIHRRCLADWQHQLRAGGQGRRAHICELCKAPYRLSGSGLLRSGSPGPHGRRRPLPRRLLDALRDGLADAVSARSWLGVALRVWRSYVMAHGIAHALRLGVTGFSSGLSLGRCLIEEQAGLLHSLLSFSSSLLGSPYAEMLWCQAVGALFVGMLSELVYTSILGLLGGLAYGFCMGYVGAVKASVRLMSSASWRVGSAAAVFAARLLRRALRVVLRV